MLFELSRLRTFRSLRIGTACLALVLASGCASHRISSNVDEAATGSAANVPVLIAENGLPGRKFTDLGIVHVSIKKLTVFNSNPTKEQAIEALKDKARILGADAVIDVKYDFGVGATTWGYMDATGKAVKLQ